LGKHGAQQQIGVPVQLKTCIPETPCKEFINLLRLRTHLRPSPPIQAPLAFGTVRLSEATPALTPKADVLDPSEHFCSRDGFQMAAACRRAGSPRPGRRLKAPEEGNRGQQGLGYGDLIGRVAAAVANSGPFWCCGRMQASRYGVESWNQRVPQLFWAAGRTTSQQSFMVPAPGLAVEDSIAFVSGGERIMTCRTP
jgi:hypothetical protein